MGAFGQVVAGGVIGGLSYAADCYVNDKAMRLDEAIVSVAFGALAGKIGGDGANKGFTLTRLIKDTRRTIDRERRRANQQYAQKAIFAARQYRNNTLSYTAWGSSVRFTVGCEISTWGTGIYSRADARWRAPEWNPR